MAGSSLSALETEIAGLLEALNRAIQDPKARTEIQRRVAAIRRQTAQHFPDLEKLLQKMTDPGGLGIW